MAAPSPTTIAIENKNLPIAHLIAVIAFGRVAGGGAKVGKIGGRIGGQIFMVAHRRPNARFMPAPGRLKTVGKFACRSRLVDRVA